ncbi:MAG: hypothetical protein ACREFP_27185 [Acetobacteraceae bacterium]
MRAGYGCVLIALVLAGCAGKTTTAVPLSAGGASAVTHPVDLSYGTILVERPIMIGEGGAAPGEAGSVGGGDIRASILTAIEGQAESGVQETMPGGASEFIVRVDDGQTISVIQGDALRLRRGERVMIVHGAETRLAPAAQG